MPAAEADVSVELVRQLLAGQHPDLAAELVVHEQRWLPVLAPGLPLPVPAPVRVGQPTGRFPWNWSVVPFLPGQVAALAAPDDLALAAVALGEFLAALHVPAPPEAPANPFRGGPLADGGDREAHPPRGAQIEPARAALWALQGGSGSP
jgi:aminoglycoside phosphotransferase (APT) family kinase protein